MTRQELATLTVTLARLTHRFKEDLGAWSTANMLAHGLGNLRHSLAQKAVERQQMAVYNALFEALDVPLPASEEYQQAYSFALHCRLAEVRIFLLRAMGEFPGEKPLSAEDRLAALRVGIFRPPPVWYLTIDNDTRDFVEPSVYVADHRQTQNGVTA
jgi:hypothetical protein